MLSANKTVGQEIIIKKHTQIIKLTELKFSWYICNGKRGVL